MVSMIGWQFKHFISFSLKDTDQALSYSACLPLITPSFHHISCPDSSFERPFISQEQPHQD